MKKKIIVLTAVLLFILVIVALFISYKNIVLSVDITRPGNAVITDDPIAGRTVLLYENEYTTLKINVKNFFNTKVYPVISNKNIIDYDKDKNIIVAKKSGNATIYFETLFGMSKSEKISITVYSKEDLEYEMHVKESENTDQTNNIETNHSNFSDDLQVKFMDTNSLPKINEIYLDSNKIDIDNFILNERTYIDIFDYCSKIDCTVSKNGNSLSIEKNISDVKFLVTHEIGTDTFKTTIINGNQNLEYDIGSKYIDVKSCPKDGLECNDTTAYLPLRFLMQALGYTVTWEQETNNVSINNYLYEKFNSDNKLMVTEELKNENDKIESNSKISQDNQYYVYVTDKENVVQNYQVVLSFSSDVENGATTDKIYEINGNNLKLIDKENIENSKMKALLIKDICDENDKSSCGSFPIIIDFKPNELFEVNTSSTGDAQSVDGDGYSQTYTKNGVTFKEYKQSNGSYASQPYWGGTMANSGCGPTAVAIVCSGYGNETPSDVATYMDKTYGYTGPDPLNGALQHYGFNSKIINYTQGNENQKKELQEHLTSGGVVIVSVCSPAKGGDCVNVPSSDFAVSSHIMAILDIDSNNVDNVYVSNPNPNPAKKTGWQSLDYVLKHVRGISYYILASK